MFALARSINLGIEEVDLLSYLHAMCGIFGYKGKKEDARSILLHGLQRLEYRGYDSAGICIGHQDIGLQSWKSVGKVASLASKVNKVKAMEGNY